MEEKEKEENRLWQQHRLWQFNSSERNVFIFCVHTWKPSAAQRGVCVCVCVCSVAATSKEQDSFRRTKPESNVRLQEQTH